jgi:hypothetical protein
MEFIEATCNILLPANPIFIKYHISCEILYTLQGINRGIPLYKLKAEGTFHVIKYGLL